MTVQFEKHQPERRSGVGPNLFCNGGCCCCSCCLHALAGLIGAAAGSAKSKTPSTGPVAGCYWACLALLMVLTVVLGPVQDGGLAGGAIIVLVFLPLGQLGASALTLVCIKIGVTAFPDKRASLLMLGKITLYSFFGALAGVCAMALGLMMFR